MELRQIDKLPPRERLKLMILLADEQELDRIMEAFNIVTEDDCSHE